MASPKVQAERQFAIDFPSWVVRKIGEPLRTETDWNAASYPNVKDGIFASSTGTLSKDTSNLIGGGAASLKMLTAAANGDTTEWKYRHSWINVKGAFLAMEFKWAQAFANGLSQFDVGIENRDAANIKHGRWRWTPTSGAWLYETANTVYGDFAASIGGSLPVQKPIISATGGTPWGWARCIIDPTNNKYVGFEAAGLLGIETRDMRGLNITCVTSGASTSNDILWFLLATANGANAEAMYVTDVCLSTIPSNQDPFSGDFI